MSRRARQITVHLDGPRVAKGRLRVDDFGHLIRDVQLSLKRVGLARAGRPGRGPGRLPKEIEAACSLEVVSLDRGSLFVTLALPDQSSQGSLFDDPGEEALAFLVDGLAQIEESRATWPESIEPSVIEPLLDMSRLLDRGIERIELRLGDALGEPGMRHRAVVNRHVRDRLRSQIERPLPSETATVGLLMEIDFKDHTAEVHEPSGNVVRVSFTSDEDELMREAAKARVRALGGGERHPDGRLARLVLKRLEILEDGTDDGKDASARLPHEGRPTPWRRDDDPFRGAKPLADLGILMGGLPDDRDPEEIITDLRQSRVIRPLGRRE
jgi:hypothetical protein